MNRNHVPHGLKLRGGLLALLLLFAGFRAWPGETAAEAGAVYAHLRQKGEALPDASVFEKAYRGYLALRAQGRCGKQVLAIADFRLSSSQKRLWIIDLSSGCTLLHTWVAHGQGSGAEFARSFSNAPQSHQSSLGFYVAQETYHGRHGLSLRLQGLEPGFNDKARDRAIVVHGADYVSPSFIAQHGRLGRSHGCPAVPSAQAASVIEALRQGACLFLYYPDPAYERESKLLAAHG